MTDKQTKFQIGDLVAYDIALLKKRRDKHFNWEQFCLDYGLLVVLKELKNNSKAYKDNVYFRYVLFSQKRQQKITETNDVLKMLSPASNNANKNKHEIKKNQTSNI